MEETSSGHGGNHWRVLLDGKVGTLDARWMARFRLEVETCETERSNEHNQSEVEIFYIQMIIGQVVGWLLGSHTMLAINDQFLSFHNR